MHKFKHSLCFIKFCFSLYYHTAITRHLEYATVCTLSPIEQWLSNVFILKLLKIPKDWLNLDRLNFAIAQKYLSQYVWRWLWLSQLKWFTVSFYPKHTGSRHRFQSHDRITSQSIRGQSIDNPTGHRWQSSVQRTGRSFCQSQRYSSRFESRRSLFGVRLQITLDRRVDKTARSSGDESREQAAILR